MDSKATLETGQGRTDEAAHFDMAEPKVLCQDVE
jgi:hypothetical protein